MNIFSVARPAALSEGSSHSSQRMQRCLQLLAICWLTCICTSCAFPGLASTSQQLPVANSSTPSSSLPPIHFPQDEGAHNDLTEWWYYTGQFEATDSSGHLHRYGFEFVIFQALRSNLPAFYPSHFAISDITRGSFQYTQRTLTLWNSPTPQGISTSGIDLQEGNWSMQGLGGKDHLIASMSSYAIDLHLVSTKPPMLHNGNGLINAIDGFSYYYSRTHMELTGTVSDHGQTMQVHGLAWMDHQWGNFLTLGGGGWDWYSLQLSNNVDVMLYVIRGPSGSILTTYADMIGSTAALSISSGLIQSTPLGSWTSPVTHITYPSGWSLKISDPLFPTNLTIQPLLKDQELVALASTGNLYWEGAVSIQGKSQNQAVTGQGYVELTAYQAAKL